MMLLAGGYNSSLDKDPIAPQYPYKPKDYPGHFILKDVLTDEDLKK